MKILVTGGTGFLGRRMVERLAPNHDLRLLVRKTSDRSRFPDNVTFAEGDVTDAASLEAAAEGCDAILHAAALVKILAPSADFDRINVRGLDHVLAAGEKVGVERIVYVSSFMALGPTENGPERMLDESAPARDRKWINDYERTKTLSDRAARRAIENGAPLCVVYPGVIYGPGELTEGNIVVRHVLDLVNGQLPALLGKPQRIWNYSFVEDVASGIVRVLEDAPLGERYVLAGDNVTQGRFYEIVGEQTGVKMPSLRMPDFLAKTSGFFMKSWAQMFGGTPKLTPDLVDVYTHDWALSSRKAQEEIGYTYRSFEEGLQATLEWLSEEGIWPARRS
ncbi:MAG: NAD-dependent epimerase/dehydratase family protein [Thermoanaerobaculia bacterium]|nr:NAD-dependent epimerase/dehydratase family protein [Thermoanaerobaculia bacterium]